MSTEFKDQAQNLMCTVDHIINSEEAFKAEGAGYIIAITAPDPNDKDLPRIVAMMSQPAHPEMVEGMINKFFRKCSYGVFPIEEPEDR